MKDTPFKSDPQDPLVPAEVSFSGYRYIPLDIKLLTESDIAFLSGDAYKAALHLLAKSWQETPATSLPDDDRRLALLAGFGKGPAAMLEWAKVKDEALSDFVLCSDGRLYSQSLQARALEAWDATLARQKQTAKGRAKIAANRAKNAEEPASRTASVTKSVTETVTDDVTEDVIDRKEEYIIGHEIIADHIEGKDVDVPAPLNATSTVTPRRYEKFEGNLLPLTDTQMRDFAKAFPSLIDINKEITDAVATLSRTPPTMRLDRLKSILRDRNNEMVPASL